MHYNLLFNGCSYTCGTELEGKEKDYEYQRTHRFSHLISNQLEMTYDNISKAGNSNDCIVRETIKWFEAGNTCDIAIIQFTSMSRIEYITERGNRAVNFPLPERINSQSNHKDPTFNHDLINAYQHYYRNFYNDNIGNYNFYKNLFILEQYFEKNNIKYIFIRLSDKDILNANDCLNFYWECFCKVNYTDINSILGTILKIEDKNNFAPDYRKDGYRYLAGGHPSKLGHQRIANYIINEINNLDL